MTVDIKNFYLNMPMSRYEYIRIKLTNIPDKIIQQYNLCDNVFWVCGGSIKYGCWSGALIAGAEPLCASL